MGVLCGIGLSNWLTLHTAHLEAIRVTMEIKSLQIQKELKSPPTESRPSTSPTATRAKEGARLPTSPQVTCGQSDESSPVFAGLNTERRMLQWNTNT